MKSLSCQIGCLNHVSKIFQKESLNTQYTKTYNDNRQSNLNSKFFIVS